MLGALFPVPAQLLPDQPTANPLPLVRFRDLGPLEVDPVPVVRTVGNVAGSGPTRHTRQSAYHRAGHVAPIPALPGLAATRTSGRQWPAARRGQHPAMSDTSGCHCCSTSNPKSCSPVMRWGQDAGMLWRQTCRPPPAERLSHPKRRARWANVSKSICKPFSDCGSARIQFAWPLSRYFCTYCPLVQRGSFRSERHNEAAATSWPWPMTQNVSVVP